MRICVLSRRASIYSTRRIVEACVQRGHQVQVINPLRCYMNIECKNPSVHYREKVLERFDAVVPRIGAGVTFFGTAVLRQFEMMGVYCLNSSQAINRSRDKLRALQILSQKGLGLPVTGFAHSTRKTRDLIQLVGGAPLIIKLLEGTQGKGVVLAENDQAAESVIDAFRNLDAHFLVQEFIKESKASDIRCFVIGGKVVAAMLRQGKAGEFRSNLHRGGVPKPITLTAEERHMAVKAAAAMRLEVAGVDLLRSNRGPLVIEVNSSPGLEGIEQHTEQDIAGKMIDYVTSQVKEGTTDESMIDSP